MSNDFDIFRAGRAVRFLSGADPSLVPQDSPIGALGEFQPVGLATTAENADLATDATNAVNVENTPATVTVDDTGLTIIDGALTVTNGDDVVIIDGTSNMFKILVTGSLSGTGNDLTQTDIATVTLTGLGTFATTPGHISYISPANDVASNQQLGIYVPANSNSWVASTSGGTTTAAGVTAQYLTYIKTRLNGSSQCVVIMTMVNHSGSSQTNYGRYYILVEAAL
jgi:hypothetical protein